MIAALIVSGIVWLWQFQYHYRHYDALDKNMYNTIQMVYYDACRNSIIEWTDGPFYLGSDLHKNLSEWCRIAAEDYVNNMKHAFRGFDEAP